MIERELYQLLFAWFLFHYLPMPLLTLKIQYRKQEHMQKNSKIIHSPPTSTYHISRYLILHFYCIIDCIQKVEVPVVASPTG